MNRVKLRRIAEFFRAGQAADEKMLIVQKKNTVADNGSIQKDLSEFKMAETVAIGKKIEEEEEELPMTFTRKLFMFLSINVGVFYVVFFAWILPCRKPFCQISEKSWEINITNASLLTNLALINTTGLTSLAIFAYTNEQNGEQNLQALAMGDGRTVWSQTLNFHPGKIMCRWSEIMFDADADEIADCLIIGENILTAINASNGYVFWQRKTSIESTDLITIAPENNSTLSSIILIAVSSSSKDDMLISAKHERIKTETVHLLVLDGSSGETLELIDTPCRKKENLGLLGRLAPGLNSGADVEWMLICCSENATDIWEFSQPTHFDGNSGKFIDFNLLYRWSMNGERGGDVITAFSRSAREPSILVARGNAVTTVMLEGRKVSWSRVFGESVITHVVSGSFFNSNTEQFAVAENTNSSLTIHILDAKDGSVSSSTSIGKWNIVSLWKIRFKGVQLDSLLIETHSLSEENTLNSTRGFSSSQRRYFLLEYNKKTASIATVMTAAGVYGDSSLGVSTDGSVYLLLASESDVTGTGVMIKKYVIKSPMVETRTCWIS